MLFFYNIHVIRIVHLINRFHISDSLNLLQEILKDETWHILQSLKHSKVDAFTGQFPPTTGPPRPRREVKALIHYTDSTNTAFSSTASIMSLSEPLHACPAFSAQYSSLRKSSVCVCCCYRVYVLTGNVTVFHHLLFELLLTHTQWSNSLLQSHANKLFGWKIDERMHGIILLLCHSF